MIFARVTLVIYGIGILRTVAKRAISSVKSIHHGQCPELGSRTILMFENAGPRYLVI